MYDTIAGMNLFDTHAHFTVDAEKTSATLKRAADAGVSRLMAVGGSPELNRAALLAAEASGANPHGIPRVLVALGSDRDQAAGCGEACPRYDFSTVIDNRKLNFKQDIDVRGMRGDEAINAITYFIDDAILVGVSRVRILHGTGTGILRQLIRQYLATIPNVTHYRDEHVQFGGAGITVVDLG